jgi:hypothetical protein
MTAVPCGFDDLTLSGAWEALRTNSLREYLTAHQRDYQVQQLDGVRYAEASGDSGSRIRAQSADLSADAVAR